MANRVIKTRMVVFLLPLLLVLVDNFPVYCADWNPLSDTGQSTCYNDTWDATAISCPANGEALYGQDAHYSGLIPTYKNNGDQTVSDLNTDLMWQQNGGNGAFAWQDAINYCAGLTYATYNDWRLPSYIELVSIIDYTRDYPAIHPVFVEVSSPLYPRYWTSTPSAIYTSYAWQVSLGSGIDEQFGKSQEYYARCVRDDI